MQDQGEFVDDLPVFQPEWLVPRKIVCLNRPIRLGNVTVTQRMPPYTRSEPSISVGDPSMLWTIRADLPPTLLSQRYSQSTAYLFL